MYTVIVKKKATKQFQKLQEKDRTRVLAALQALRTNPFAGKKLDRDLVGHYSVRVWPYRIIYSIDKNIVTVTVVAIGHRKDVYR